jgi:hypothetical protein
MVPKRQRSAPWAASAQPTTEAVSFDKPVFETHGFNRRLHQAYALFTPVARSAWANDVSKNVQTRGQRF